MDREGASALTHPLRPGNQGSETIVLDSWAVRLETVVVGIYLHL